MKSKGWITGLLIIILACVTIGIRIYYINNLMADVAINEDIYNMLKVINVNGNLADLSSVFVVGFNIKTLYMTALYIAFLILGNFTVAGIYINILFQTVTVLLVYAAVQNISNRYVAFAVSIVAAVIPSYFYKLSEISTWNMKILLAVVLLCAVTLILRLIYNKTYNSDKKNLSAMSIAKEENPQPVNPEPMTDNTVYEDKSMREISFDDLVDKKVKYLDNPLPVPKRREHKEMDFSIELTGENDDYDLKDMSGKDFYDIE